MSNLILVVDDERVIRESLSKILGSAGYDVSIARDGASALMSFAERRPALVLLDVMMPGTNGLTCCAKMRELDRETPIVFLSALDSETDQIRGLELGADDYVPKSASRELLLARIRKSLERADRYSTADAPVSMTRTEAAIYRLLDSDRGRFFSYREIFTGICGDGYSVGEGAVRVHMSNMRRKLPSGEKLVARRGFGYALKS